MRFPKIVHSILFVVNLYYEVDIISTISWERYISHCTCPQYIRTSIQTTREKKFSMKVLTYTSKSSNTNTENNNKTKVLPEVNFSFDNKRNIT